MRTGCLMLLAFALALQSTPDFSGLWQLNLDKSTLRGPAPKELLMKIQQREQTLVQTVLVVAADGRDQQLMFTYDLTGGETTNVVGGGDAQSRTRWSGAELVIDSTLETAARTFHFKDHWSLSADGQTLRMAHPDDDLAGQISVLERAAPSLAARFKSE